MELGYHLVNGILLKDICRILVRQRVMSRLWRNAAKEVKKGDNACRIELCEINVENNFQGVGG